MSEAKWYLRTQDETFGPETQEKLVEWARMGRIQPGQEVSDDNVIWRRAEEVPFLDMRFSIDLGDGNPRGPFNKAAADALIASGRLPPTATVVETRAPFEENAAPGPAEELHGAALEAEVTDLVQAAEAAAEAAPTVISFLGRPLSSCRRRIRITSGWIPAWTLRQARQTPQGRSPRPVQTAAAATRSAARRLSCRSWAVTIYACARRSASRNRSSVIVSSAMAPSLLTGIGFN